MHFPATFIPGENGHFEIIFNDLPGCRASGSNFDEAMAEAESVLTKYVEALIENGEKIPTPSSIDELEKNNAEERNNIIHKYVHYKLKNNDRKTGIQRISISIKPAVLRRLDTFAENLGISRSALIALAVNDYCIKSANKTVV